MTVLHLRAEDGSGEAMFSPDRVYRYSLRRNLPSPLFRAPTSRVLLVTMLNPSKAGAVDDDMTITKLKGFANMFGCGAVWVGNLYGLVSTDPKGLERHPDPIGLLNDDFIRGMAIGAPKHGGDVLSVVAWGSHPMATEQRIATVTALLPKPLFCFGVTMDGQPRHPSRLAYSTPLVRWQRRAA